MAGRNSKTSDPREDPFGLCHGDRLQDAEGRWVAGHAATMATRFTSYDDTDPTQVPSDATHCSYYADHPLYSNLNAMHKQCPNAKLLPVVGFPYNPRPGTDHEYVGWQYGISCDCEPTDLTPAQVGVWAAARRRAGVTPVIYANLSEMGQCVAAMKANGLQRHEVKIHTAHWTFQPHICSGLATAWGTVNADATQWTDKALGRNLDASLCEADYFGSVAPPPPPPHGVRGVAKFAVELDTAKGHWTVHREKDAGSLSFAQHEKLAVATLTYDMHTGKVAIRAGD